jgi:hypothetical protein
LNFTARLLLLLMILSLAGQAQTWRVESSSKLTPLGHEAGFVIKQIAGPAKAEMKLVVL